MMLSKIEERRIRKCVNSRLNPLKQSTYLEFQKIFKDIELKLKEREKPLKKQTITSPKQTPYTQAQIQPSLTTVRGAPHSRLLKSMTTRNS
jgi:hypothetical protein